MASTMVSSTTNHLQSPWLLEHPDLETGLLPPPPPPPSPSYGNPDRPFLIDEQLLLSMCIRSESLQWQPSAIPERNLVMQSANTHPSMSLTSTTHQARRERRVENLHVEDTNIPGQTHSRPVVTRPKITGKRRITAPSRSTQTSRPPSSSSSGLLGSSKGCEFSSDAYDKDSKKKTPSTPGKFRPSSDPRPSISRREISSPINSMSSASPKHISSPRFVPPSRTQSRSGSLSTSGDSSDTPLKVEMKSYFSDSEDDDKLLSKKGLLGGSQGRRNRKFRRRLSETFAFLSCGAD